MLTVTAVAAQKVREFQSSDPTLAGKAFRIAVDAGGCSGYQYDFRFDLPQPDDVAVQADGVRIVIDPQSLAIIKDSTLDFVEDFQGAGFVLNNPNATSSCGCGKSFNV